MANENLGEPKTASITMVPLESRPEFVSVSIDNQPPAPALLQQPSSHHQPHQLASQLAAQNKRKEKARIAARARRSQEASIIMEMANELHITQDKVRKLDKATIVKLAIDYIKAFEILYRFRNAYPNSPTTSSSSSPSSSSYNSSSTSSDCSTSSNNFDTISYGNGSNSDSVDNNNYSSCGGNESNARGDMIGISNCNSESNSSNCSNDRGIYEPKLSTSSIFTPKTDDMDSHFLMIDESDGRPSFVLRPDTEIEDEDDLTHLAPQAGDVSISLEVESLEGIVLDTGLFGTSSSTGPISPPISLIDNDGSNIIVSNKNMAPPTTMMNTKDLIEPCCINNNSNNIGSVD